MQSVRRRSTLRFALYVDENAKEKADLREQVAELETNDGLTACDLRCVKRRVIIYFRLFMLGRSEDSTAPSH